MRYLLIVLFLFTANVQAHGSSHYVCTSERVGLDLVKHCESYNRPVPEVRYVDYYSPEQVQHREDMNKIFIGFLTVCGVALVVGMVLLLFVIKE